MRRALVTAVLLYAAGCWLRTREELASHERHLAVLRAQVLANQQRIHALRMRQDPQIQEAVQAALNGGIGGRVGFGWQRPDSG